MILALLAALTATPVTLPATFKAARCGDTVTLQRGDYGAISAPRLICPEGQRLRVDASAARMSALTLRALAGLDWQGGNLIGPREQQVGVAVDGATRVSVAGMTMKGPRIGISIARSDNIDVIGNRFDGIRSDGVNVTIAHHIRIIGNQCVNFDPILATYDKAGKLLVDGDHPDCIQGWTQPGTAPLSDVLMTGNSGQGLMQGIWFGATSPAGYDRITAIDNHFRISAWHGVSILGGRKTVIRDNTVQPIPGARQLGGNRGLVWPWVYTTGDAVACGNVVAAKASQYGTSAC